MATHGVAGQLPAEAPAELDVNARKSTGDEVDVERRVRPKVELPLAGGWKGSGQGDTANDLQDDLDKRLRALVEVAAQRKGDSPLPNPPRSLFQPFFPNPYGSAEPPIPAVLNLPTQEALGGGQYRELPEGPNAGRAPVEAPLAGRSWTGASDLPHSLAGQLVPLRHHGLPQPTDCQHPVPGRPQELQAAEPPSLGEDVPISQLKGRSEKLHGGEDGGREPKMGEESEQATGQNGFGPTHGLGGLLQHGFGAYGAQPPYELHEQYTASAEAQQLAEHAGFGGGHMEADEECEALRSLDLVEVGFPRSSVEELQTLPQHDLITRVLDLEERISAVVREKQLEAAARQEAEDNAARYAEESRQLRHVVREKNGYKKGVLQETAATEGPPPGLLQMAGRFTITREGSLGGGLRLEKGNKGEGKLNSPVREKWKAEWKKATLQSQYVVPASFSGGGEYMTAFAGEDGLRPAANGKGFWSRKVGSTQATHASRLLAILGAKTDADDDEDHDSNGYGVHHEYVARLPLPPRPVAPAGAAPFRPRAESTVGLDDLGEFLRTCCQAKQTGHMTLHRVLWYTYLAWRQKVASPRPSVSSGGVGLSQCMHKLGHRERLFTREIQAKKAGCKGYEGGGKYWMGLVVLDKALVKTGRQWLAMAKRTGNSNRVTFSRDAAIVVQACEGKEEPADENGATGEVATET